MRGLWRDNRIGGLPRWTLCDESDLMQLPQELRQCVFFTYAHRALNPQVGSGFMISVPLGVDHAWACYAVTARHCVEPIDADGDVEALGLRFNTKAGGSDYIWTKPEDWIKHETADIAVLPFCPDQTVFEWLAWPVSDLATTEFVRMRGFGPGEDVLITGLLVNHPGKTRVMPITRVGNVAAFPDDPVKLDTGDDVVALVEVRSLGGLSGSPAFLHPGDIRTDGGTFSVGTSGQMGGPNYLLGLVHGFYPLTENDPDGVAARPGEKLNTGISVVVWADRILDIINLPQLQRSRDQVTEELKRKGAPTPASGSASKPPEFERFEDLARKVVGVPKTEIDEKRES